MQRLPILVLVSGAPGSGKTTLSPQLASALGFVRLARDDVKERLWDAWAGQPELRAQVPGAHWGAYHAALDALRQSSYHSFPLRTPGHPRPASCPPRRPAYCGIQA
ncbi:AAA family ATPase [Deinococcus koreensis]|uniref:UDP-N-acetylglucosamine kinase n=1 Tax=Deinococcus koreensis TaxID=2054903 RepID=A0A2K3UZU6_9DEIO|nr:AAA family ATPase [Deinococcus koreensis]PNY82051.1 hypothetical protein CVO96_12350 [Deinococcus koreensis]